MDRKRDEETLEKGHLEKLHCTRKKLYPKHYIQIKDTKYDLNDPRVDARLDSYWKGLRNVPAETYKEILKAIWDGFVFDLRRGRYLEMKRISEALERRMRECEDRYVQRDHVQSVIYFRKRILENVLWEHEVFGVAPYFDSLNAGSKRKVVASAVSDDVQQFIIIAADPDMRHDYIGDNILPKCDNWNERFKLYEEMCDRAEVPEGHDIRYSSPESMKASYNKKIRHSRE